MNIFVHMRVTGSILSGIACANDKKPPAEAGGLRAETPYRMPYRSGLAQQIGVPGFPPGAF
jgi:hypothetical protein